ncbi:glycosyltransferase [bacterium]|nr:MAG: glycosyltransferase [bacterium]
MTALNEPTVAFLSTYLPKQCGLATFTNDLRAAHASPDSFVVAVDDTRRDFPEEVRFVIEKGNTDSYKAAADYLNSHADVLSLQHEYGIFGGPDGSHVLEMLQKLEIPVMVTLHTVLQNPNDGQRRVLRRICDIAQRVMVMSDRACDFLADVYGVPERKIEVIPHGVPESDGIEVAPEMEAYGNDPKLLTFGLLSPGKGIEVGIDAVAKLKPNHPNVRYFVLGKTHPDLVAREGEAYRDGLAAQAKALGVEENVIFVNAFVDLPKLSSYLKGADVYVTPYRGKDQIVSGTLSYAVAFGLPVVTTPFIYAEELVAKGGGLLFPFNDSDKLAEHVDRLLADPVFRGRLRNSATILGRTMRWPVVGTRLREVLDDAIAEFKDKKAMRLREQTRVL